MVMMFKQNGNFMEPTEGANLSWLHAANPSREELLSLQNQHSIDPDFLTDILDIDELSRIEKEGEETFIILRMPACDPSQEISFFTVPFGVVIKKDVIITLCQQELELLSGFRHSKSRNIKLQNKASFVLSLFYLSAMYYLKYLKDINRKTSAIERDLQKSVKNNELIQLLTLEKSLVYFTTALKSNELVLEKLQKERAFKLTEDEMDLLENAMTENKQAIEMANIYSNILSGMMDAFASVISNNLNVVMKRLTIISLFLMIPTLIASFYGMNVNLPFQEAPWAFMGILGTSIVLAAFGLGIFKGRKLF